MKAQLLKYISIFILILICSACSEEKMNEIDTDPNNPTDVPISLLIPNVTVGVPFNVSGTDLAWYSSIFVEQTTGRHGQMRDADRRENLNSQLSENVWAYFVYPRILVDLKLIIDKGSEGGDEEGNWHNVGVAQVLFAYTMFVMTDIFGRIPYSEALQGSEGRKPKFDTQESIYTEMLNMLDDAIANFEKRSTAPVASGDFIFNGDKGQWIKLAYSLKARHLVRMSNVKDAGIYDDALEALANGFSSGEGFIFDSYGTDQKNQNPWYRIETERGHHAVSKTVYDLMNNLNDPRIPLWFTQVQGTYNPAPNGSANVDQAGLFYSRISSNIQYDVAPLPILTYDEIKFIEAECYLSKSPANPAAALLSYSDAVDAALLRAGVGDTEIAAYKSQTEVIPASPANLTLEHIHTQKYLSLWPYGSIEAFAEWRRTGIPVLTNPLGDPPRRFPYPQNEISSNKENVPEVSLSNGVWWDDGTED